MGVFGKALAVPASEEKALPTPPGSSLLDTPKEAVIVTGLQGPEPNVSASDEPEAGPAASVVAPAGACSARNAETGPSVVEPLEGLAGPSVGQVAGPAGPPSGSDAAPRQQAAAAMPGPERGFDLHLASLVLYELVDLSKYPASEVCLTIQSINRHPPCTLQNGSAFISPLNLLPVLPVQ